MLVFVGFMIGSVPLAVVRLLVCVSLRCCCPFDCARLSDVCFWLCASCCSSLTGLCSSSSPSDWLCLSVGCMIGSVPLAVLRLLVCILDCCYPIGCARLSDV